MNTSSSLSTIALQIVVSLVLSGVAGAALFTFTDYATRGVIA